MVMVALTRLMSMAMVGQTSTTLMVMVAATRLISMVMVGQMSLI